MECEFYEARGEGVWGDCGGGAGDDGLAVFGAEEGVAGVGGEDLGGEVEGSVSEGEGDVGEVVRF